MTTETGPVATGLLKQVRIAAESTYGTAPSGSGSSQILRRVSSDIALKKATYRSNEIQPDRQVHDFRHGEKSVSGTLKGELSPLTYESIFAQILAGSFTAGVSAASLTITATAAVVNTSPGMFQRATGSFLTDGFKIGDTIQATGFTSGAAANNNRYYRITGIITTANPGDTLQVGPTPTTLFPSVGTEAVVAASAAAGITISVVGKKLITPPAGSAVDASFAIEHWFSDISHSELFTGCRASKAQFSLPPTGLATVDFDIMGQDMKPDLATPYFTTPSAVTTTGLTASVNGVLRAGGVDYAIVTGMNFTINVGYTPEAIIGSNITPYLFPGIQDVTGQFTALYQDNVLPSAFVNETELDLLVKLTLNNTVNADFISFYFPRIKLTSSNADDKPNAIVRTYGFQALNNETGGSGQSKDLTTVVIQDSLAT